MGIDCNCSPGGGDPCRPESVVLLGLLLSPAPKLNELLLARQKFASAKKKRRRRPPAHLSLSYAVPCLFSFYFIFPLFLYPRKSKGNISHVVSLCTCLVDSHWHRDQEGLFASWQNDRLPRSVGFLFVGIAKFLTKGGKKTPLIETHCSWNLCSWGRRL